MIKDDNAIKNKNNNSTPFHFSINQGFKWSEADVLHRSKVVFEKNFPVKKFHVTLLRKQLRIVEEFSKHIGLLTAFDHVGKTFILAQIPN